MVVNYSSSGYLRYYQRHGTKGYKKRTEDGGR